MIILTGPTTTGKSDTALELAEKLGGEIINADSMQVYRYFDIGTAKPGPEARRRVPHHLIDILEPDEEFNAFDFKTLALNHIADLHRRGKIPILAGGTGLYIKVLTENHDCAVQVSRIGGIGHPRHLIGRDKAVLGDGHQQKVEEIGLGFGRFAAGRRPLECLEACRRGRGG